jgi:hypothetical protein
MIPIWFWNEISSWNDGMTGIPDPYRLSGSAGGDLTENALLHICTFFRQMVFWSWTVVLGRAYWNGPPTSIIRDSGRTRLPVQAALAARIPAMLGSRLPGSTCIESGLAEESWRGAAGVSRPQFHGDRWARAGRPLGALHVVNPP